MPLMPICQVCMGRRGELNVKRQVVMTAVPLVLQRDVLRQASGRVRWFFSQKPYFWRALTC